MVGILIKVVIGLVLFAGSLVGGLAATGRLNHEGTANIPVLNALFPAPPVAEGEGDGDGDGAADAHAAPGGEVAHATGDGEHGAATDAAMHEAGQDPGKPRRRKTGKSVLNPEKPADDGHGGAAAGHGEDAAHGDDPHGGGEQAHAPTAGHAPAGHGAEKAAAKGHSAERDFDEMAELLRSQGRTSYEPGAFFRFDGMPAGLTPEQLNAAWQSVQDILRETEQRKVALDLREKELQELADDISRRWTEVSKERVDVENMQRELLAKIARFEETVKLVRDDEVQKLKQNAATLAAFERSKAAELVEQQWGTERGQDEVLRLLEFMDKDAVNEILQQLPNAMVQDILQKRMQVSREAKPSGGRG